MYAKCLLRSINVSHCCLSSCTSCKIQILLKQLNVKWISSALVYCCKIMEKKVVHRLCGKELNTNLTKKKIQRFFKKDSRNFASKIMQKEHCQYCCSIVFRFVYVYLDFAFFCIVPNWNRNLIFMTVIQFYHTIKNVLHLKTILRMFADKRSFICEFDSCFFLTSVWPQQLVDMHFFLLLCVYLCHRSISYILR